VAALSVINIFDLDRRSHSERIHLRQGSALLGLALLGLFVGRNAQA